MWRLKQFMPKEQTGLEGRTIDIGNLKIQVRNAFAEGGFSCVYLARDAIHGSKLYALKHMICNDEESLALVMKEVSVMKSLKGHPNVVTLCAHTIFDMGRTKEAFLVMDYCEKSLVSVLDSRGSGYFEEKQILVIFRDVCNAVFAMHCQSPPIAHRDLKAENLLLGSDGLWKLCDFGSTSTNHKRFEKAEEMGIEEDNIRKYTTPAYRAPEMWDLFRREIINEKVDIWALGCLLFRISYFKSAFDGESKLQVLNGNYRIPEVPKYSSSITDLIRDMLQPSPDSRPDITQVWFRVNDLLPAGLQKSLPDRPPEMHQQDTDVDEGISKPTNKTHPMPRRSPPTPPSADSTRNVSPPSLSSRPGGGGAPLGAFWASQHAKGTLFSEEKNGPKFDDEPGSHSSPPKEENMHGKSVNKSEDHPSKDFEMKLSLDESDHGSARPKASKSQSTSAFQNETFNTFVAEFDTNKLNAGVKPQKSGNEVMLEAELERLKEQLKQANTEKAEITSKYEKLSSICRSQRQEIQELKQALAARTPSPKRDASQNQMPTGVQSSPNPPEKIEGTIWELQQGLFATSSPSQDSKQWQAFAEGPKPQTSVMNNTPKSVRTKNGQQSKQVAGVTSGTDNTWGFGTESFTAIPTATSQISKPTSSLNSSQRFGELKNIESKPASQPAGWSGF